MAVKQIVKQLTIFIVIGLTYFGIEMAVRGRSDVSMIICAGIIGVIVGLLNDIFSYDMLIQAQLFIGSVIATVCEGITGLILVAIYGFNPVWDYSGLWGNFFWGQCNIWFCVIWVGLVFVAILIADSIDYYLFDGERPYYKASKGKVWFMLPEKKT
jgi:hypothetical protein